MRPEGAYPKYFVWKEGYALHEEGQSIYTIKGIDPKYYILLWGDIYRNDNCYDAVLDKEIQEMSEKAHIQLEAARAVNSMLSNLECSGYSKNTAKLLTDDTYGEANESVRIISAWIDTRDYSRSEKDNIPEGFFEVNFGKRAAPDDYKSWRRPDIKLYKKEKNKYIFDGSRLNNHIKVPYTDEPYNRIFSYLIDNHIYAIGQYIEDQVDKCNSGYLTLCFANGSSRKISIKDLSGGCIKAFDYLFGELVYPIPTQIFSTEPIEVSIILSPSLNEE